MRERKVLIADDHPQTVAACRAALEADGSEVLAAGDLTEAARLLGEARPRLVVLDAALPGGDAVGFCARLAGVHGGERVRLLLLVPPRCPDALLAALRPFAAECLFKPFHAAELRRRVAALLAAPPAPADSEVQTGDGPPHAVREGSPAWRSDSLAGREVGGCRLERPLGRGASGTVYLGRHLLLDVPVAVKIFSPSPAQWSAEDLRRFVRGARAAAQIEDPGIVGVLNAGVEGKFHFLIQRYVEGETLKARIEAQGRLGEPAVLGILSQVAAGLAAVHRLGIIHRDVKPANIILAHSGRAMLTDFGLARPSGTANVSSETGLVGTPYYMSPEQCGGEPLDPRSDLYSLGATAYHALAGRPPFLGDTPVDVIRGHLGGTPTPLRESGAEVSGGMERLVMKLLAKSPAARYPGAEDLVSALARLGGRSSASGAGGG